MNTVIYANTITMINFKWGNCLKIIVPILLMSACVKSDKVPDPIAEIPLFTSPSNFNYETSKEVGINIQLLTNNDQPLSKVLVNIMDKPSDENGRILYTALTDANGKINGTLMLPTYLTKVVIDPNYIGVMRNAVVRVDAQNIICTLGGSNGYGGNVEAQKQVNSPFISPVLIAGRTQALTYKYMGTYDNTWGKPNYLVSPNDVVSSTLLGFVNASLPEQRPVPTYHPAYMNSSAPTNLAIVNDGDVYVTFVHEGAGYTSTLAYFTFPTNNPPTSTSGIDTLRIVFPNASLAGSSGNLNPGNKVKLGNFKANTSIGFCLIANGWNTSTKTVGAGNAKFYSIDALNPETTTSLKRHTVLLYDNTDNLFMLGMDDQNRQSGGSDNDFNDIVFYATCTNSAISTTNINPIDQPGDSDGDGVSNVYDQFPNDATRAYINYYPSANTYGSLVFEDTWPNTGDYDLNDVVVNYRYKVINNGTNNTVEVFGDYVLQASGASFNNGFGVQFPFAPSVVSSVTGTRNNSGYSLSLNSNNTESGQAKAVIIPFNDFFYVSPRSSANSTVNTQPELAFRTPDTLHVKVSFTSPITPATLGTAPFNQFIFASLNRGKEIHLPGEKPTDRVNTSFFNTIQDNTIPSQNRYYKTSTNMPFGIGLPQKFDYPIEGKAINAIYLKFSEWAQSGGTSYPNWYKDTTGYRSANYFYK